MYMKKSVSMLIITVLSIFITHVSMAAMAIETPAWQKVKTLGKQGLYTFLFFGNDKTETGKNMRILLNDVEKELNIKSQDLSENNANRKGPGVSVADVVEVSLDEPKEQELIKFFRVQANPTVAVIAPNEAITGYFPGSTDKAALISCIISAKEADVVKGLQEGKAAFVCFSKEKDSHLAAIKTNLEAIGSNFKGAVNIIYADIDDKKEEKLIENFGALPNETAVFVLLPPGVIAAKLKGADVTKENLMKALLASRKGGCCPVGSQKKCN